jgi:hypothetical protein
MVLARPRARSSIEINPKNSLYPHRHFTEHQVGAFGNSPRENNLNHETSSLLIRWFKSNIGFTLQQSWQKSENRIAWITTLMRQELGATTTTEQLERGADYQFQTELGRNCWPGCITSRATNQQERKTNRAALENSRRTEGSKKKNSQRKWCDWSSTEIQTTRMEISLDGMISAHEWLQGL